MVKKTKDKIDKKKNKVEYNSNFWISMFILVLMVLSIAGFAMISGGPNAGAKYKKQQDVPLQYFEQYGVWATIKNGQEFVFKDIYQFNNMSSIENLADKIKMKNNLDVYVDSNFDPSAQLLFLKGLKALNINSNIITNISCDENTILLLNDNKNITGGCLQFISPQDQEYNQTNALIYYLVK